MKNKNIEELAKQLRKEVTNVEDLQTAIMHLFWGPAELSQDNEGQLVVYTGMKTTKDKDLCVYFPPVY